ncbi:desmocollin 2 like [Hippoglossus hippoglossus]|uniref:desmocollin 2 like n=1 Tax=Hippoglossus hippoglossus TaxID=8267 RepID=UPI00148DCC45|nr:desmocollin 2 like [Hippoglossus hippoglossus]
MAKVLLITLCVMLILPRVESCFIPKYLYVNVPQTIPPEYEITKVDVSDCDRSTVRITVTDPSFTVMSSGVIVASTAVYVGGSERTFSVRARDYAGPGSEMEVHLVPSTLSWKPSPKKIQGFLKRSKRRWAPPPFNILENDKGPFPKVIDKVVSDSEALQDVYYTISGPGFDKYPANVFSLNRDTGVLSVHKPVDREMFPKFILLIRVFNKKTNVETDRPLNIQVIVDDVNDNAPQFISPLQFTVLEQSKAGTVVGKVNASDKDEPGSKHVKIKYSLKNGLDLFAINSDTGVITTVTNTLDREVKDTHLVNVEIRDMEGAVNGLFNTATATITVGDINDNPPTFTKASYTPTVQENENDKLILRIPVEDKDVVDTPNWISKFEVTKGNDNGNFRIDRDPKTNDGLLYVVKPLDFEETPKVKLEITARNEAELSDPKLQWKSIPVDLTVTNIDEGPLFTAPTIRFIVKENTPNGTRIGSYTAVDPETKSSSGIKYYKESDPAAWINVDKNTGELKVANTIDRESNFVQDGIYNITMKAVDATSKTGTGTVIIQVEDVNDNVPTVPVSELIMCEKPGELGSVLVVAEDNDAAPFSSPFTFSIPTDSDGRWSVVRDNATAAMLKHNKELPTGKYIVAVDITDLQGFGKTQMVPVRICECRGGVCLDQDRSSSLGSMALLAMLLPLALLLLLCLLLGLFCLTEREKWVMEDIGDSGGIILKSNTEGRGEEVDVSLIPVTSFAGDEAAKGSVKGLSAGYPGLKSMSTLGPHSTLGAYSTADNWMYKSGPDLQYTTQYDAQYDGQYGGNYEGQLVGSGVNFDNGQLQQGSSFLHNWEANGIYLHGKLQYLGTEEDGRYADDIGHSYGFEGVGSAAGSVGCCSDFGDGDNLDFLNALGPKFKTLADVCQKT